MLLWNQFGTCSSVVLDVPSPLHLGVDIMRDLELSINVFHRNCSGQTFAKRNTSSEYGDGQLGHNLYGAKSAIGVIQDKIESGEKDAIIPRSVFLDSPELDCTGIDFLQSNKCPCSVCYHLSPCLVSKQLDPFLPEDLKCRITITVSIAAWSCAVEISIRLVIAMVTGGVLRRVLTMIWSRKPRQRTFTLKRTMKTERTLCAQCAAQG